MHRGSAFSGLTLGRALGLLCLLQAAQTAYAMWLNRLFYSRFPPFFDSMGYTLAYAEILSIARESGVGAALRASLTRGTVSLPWLFTSVFSPVLPYSRDAGIWFQEVWMTALACSVCYYLARYRGLTPAVALCWSLPFVGFRAVYAANGGVSDFRMDLLLYLLLGCTTVWYLATYETDSWKPWAVSGAFLLLAILNRATAPVYLGAMFGPVLALRGEWRAVRRAALFWGPAALAGMAALAANYRKLHYYYFEWGADPNAHLPLGEALRHVLLAGWSIGVPLTLALAPLLWAAVRRTGVARLDWKLLWLGTAPAALLVARGAGLNPFASMPAVFGWMLFCLLPYAGRPVWETGAQRRIAWLVAAACLVNAAWGVKLHLYPPEIGPAMAAIRSAIERMRDDAASRGRRTAAFATAHILDVEELAIRNVLVFDYGARPRGLEYRLGGLTFRTPHGGLFTAAVPLTWEKDIRGRNDDEKLAYLVELAEKDIDYFLLPDEATITWAEQHRAHHYINTKTRELKRRLLAAGRWEPLGGPLTASSFETVTLYRKR